MSLHETKYCPRCNALLECKVGSILLCQCAAVTLDEAERIYIRKKYDDCLCAKCMVEMRSEYHQAQFDKKVQNLLKR